MFFFSNLELLNWRCGLFTGVYGSPDEDCHWWRPEGKSSFITVLWGWLPSALVVDVTDDCPSQDYFHSDDLIFLQPLTCKLILANCIQVAPVLSYVLQVLVLGKVSSSMMGTFGALLEIILILYPTWRPCLTWPVSVPLEDNISFAL